ncbi:MAG: right-handed parallel beta-helix repeat-containing protein [Actinobacteria bacterium]|nr:MAG: right-handed parallel beta-helix repeat-containing protein [Actinomycetota bacterium]
MGVVSAHHSPAVGPRGPVGPDIPVSAVERSVFARRIRVQGSTAAAVQAACRQAITQGVPVVFLPPGQYLFETEVVVPGGLTLLGSGSSTRCQTTSLSQALFRMQGDHVRFTRLKLQGASLVWDQSNDTYGIASDHNQNVHIDHCELLGFNSAADFSNAATGQVDHCFLHHCLRDGMGYGVGLDRGSYVLVSDNEFSQCRHCLASNGFGARPTHWEFLHNHVNSDDLVQNKQGAVDAHPDMDGSFVVTGNLFENIDNALDIFNGSARYRRHGEQLREREPAVYDRSGDQYLDRWGGGRVDLDVGRAAVAPAAADALAAADGCRRRADLDLTVTDGHESVWAPGQGGGRPSSLARDLPIIGRWPSSTQ